MRVTSAINSATPVSTTTMLKPRLFSTLRCLQHENPLVCYMLGYMNVQ